MASSLSAASATTYQFRVHSEGVRATVAVTPPTPAAPSLAFQDETGNVLSNLNFPDTAVGSNSAPLFVVLQNTGNAPLIFEAVPLTAPAPFSIASTTCAGSLEPMDTCTVTTTFSPVTAQTYGGPSYALTVSANVQAATLPFTGTGTMVGVAEIVIGVTGSSTFIRKTDGSWVATGLNTDGQLGLGDTVQRLSFVPVPSLTGATQVMAGQYQSFAKFSNGAWMATGNNGQGQLGLGDTTNRRSFVSVPALAGASQVVMGLYHTFAKMPDGSWSTTGQNTFGQLGLGDTTNRKNFTPVSALAGATQVVAGGYHAFAKLPDGSWRAAGYNTFGQLGLGDTTGRNIFVPVPALAGATQVVAGSFYTFAELSNGTWAATGDNTYGQMGVGGNSGRNPSFGPVPALTGASRVVAGANHTFAKMPDGSWAGAGYNGYGQLGLGDTSNRFNFTTVAVLANASQVVLGNTHTFAKLADGSLTATGNNSDGQLGLGDTKPRIIFTTVTP